MKALGERILDKMRRERIPQGTDNPELLALGAPELHFLPEVNSDPAQEREG